MKIVELKCPNCHASLTPKNNKIIKCDYCGTVIILSDENETKTERVIEKIGDELQKAREYHSSYDYKKKLDIEREASEEKTKKFIKNMLLLLAAYLIFQILILIIVKLF